MYDHHTIMSENSEGKLGLQLHDPDAGGSHMGFVKSSPSLLFLVLMSCTIYLTFIIVFFLPKFGLCSDTVVYFGLVICFISLA